VIDGNHVAQAWERRIFDFAGMVTQIRVLKTKPA